jgi:addiction module HigA family antidote
MAAAKSLGVSRQMLHGILAGRKPLSAVMCLKIARWFGGSPELWVRLQATLRPEKVRAEQEDHGSRAENCADCVG